MNIWRENENLYHRLSRFGFALIGTKAEKRAIEREDANYFAAKRAAVVAADRARREADQRNREQAAKEAKIQHAKDLVERALEKTRAAKQRKNKENRIAKAKKFVKAKKLRKVRRNGSTVFVNQNNDIVHYAILAYLLMDHGNGNHYSESSSPSYTYHSSPSSYDSGSSYSSGGSDFGGSFGGGDSGGGGASGSW